MLFNRPRHHAAGGCMLLEGINVIWYRIGESLVHTESAVPADVPALVLLTTEELEKRPILPGLESVLEHTPAVRSARFCRVEARSGCLSGTLVLPRRGKDGVRAAFGLLVTQNRIVLTDDSASLPPLLHRIAQEKRWTRGTVGHNIPGIGNSLVTALGQRDFPMVQGCVLVMSIFVMVVNLIIDITYKWIDPRVTFE